MAARFLLVIGLGILLGLPVGMQPAAAVASQPITNTLLDTVTVVAASKPVLPGSSQSARVTCPTGMTALGGGIDVGNALTMKVTSSAPTFAVSQHRLIQRPIGANPAPVGWQASARNDGTTAMTFKVGVICATLSGASTMVGSDTATPGSFKSERVTCPSSKVAVGGGIDVDNVLTMKVTSSAPTFAASQHRLIQQPDGANPAPVGWQASARNDDTTSKAFKVAVICAPLSGISTVVGSDSVTPANYRSERVTCPSGKIAVGGGIDVDNVLTMKMTSSAPTFAVSSHRLSQQPNGTNPAPVGWQVTARNDDTTSKAFKVAVICAKPVAKAFLPIVVKDYP